MSNDLAVLSSNQITELAQQIASSKILGVRTVEEATGLVILALASGRSVYTAGSDYHVINGRPTVKADAMLARFHASGGKHEFTEYTDERVTGVFSHPAGGSLAVTWTIEQAKRAGLGGKDVWKQYPRQMLRSRVVSEAIRAVYPAVAVGVYTPEEVADFDARPAAVVPAAPVVQVVESQPAEVIEPEPDPDGSVTPAQIRALAATLREAGFDGATEDGKSQGRAFLGWLAGRKGIKSIKDLNWLDATKILDLLAGPSAAPGSYRADPKLVERALSQWYGAQAATDDALRGILAV